MTDIIIIGIIVVAVILGISPALKHFKGNGGCCGGGDTVKVKKKLASAKIGEKEFLIEGMKCENCKNNVERAVNKIDGVVCEVNLRKNIAKVSYSKEVEDEIIMEAIEDTGFKVKEILSKN